MRHIDVKRPPIPDQPDDQQPGRRMQYEDLLKRDAERRGNPELNAAGHNGVGNRHRNLPPARHTTWGARVSGKPAKRKPYSANWSSSGNRRAEASTPARSSGDMGQHNVANVATCIVLSTGKTGKLVIGVGPDQTLGQKHSTLAIRCNRHGRNNIGHMSQVTAPPPQRPQSARQQGRMPEWHQRTPWHLAE